MFVKNTGTAAAYQPRGILDAVGNTPLVRLDRLRADDAHELHGKLEGMNPGGSAKDRAALRMILRAFERGDIAPGGMVVESSSGNMGIGLAYVCRVLKLRFTCVTDERTTLTNRRLIALYGANLEVIHQDDCHSSSLLERRLQRVQELLKENPGSFWPNQYANPDNAAAHRDTMREIVSALGGGPDYLFCAVSTCGTLSGCMDYIAEYGLATQVVAVDSVASAIFGAVVGNRLIPGMGAAIVPPLCLSTARPYCIRVPDKEIVRGCEIALVKEGLLVGGSSGAVIAAYLEHASSIPRGARCVLIFPDRGERYLDSVFCEEWVRANGLTP